MICVLLRVEGEACETPAVQTCPRRTPAGATERHSPFLQRPHLSRKRPLPLQPLPVHSWDDLKKRRFLLPRSLQVRFSTPLHPFCCHPRTVKCVLLGVPWSTPDACSSAPPGARKSRCTTRSPKTAAEWEACKRQQSGRPTLQSFGRFPSAAVGPYFKTAGECQAFLEPPLDTFLGVVDPREVNWRRTGR